MPYELNDVAKVVTKQSGENYVWILLDTLGKMQEKREIERRIVVHRNRCFENSWLLQMTNDAKSRNGFLAKKAHAKDEA